MKTKTEPPPELAPHDTVVTEQLLEIPAEPPPLDPPPEIPQPQPKPSEPFLRRS